jgi:hypothetical protein
MKKLEPPTLATSFEHQRPKTIKTAAMGGGNFDSVLRGVCALLSLVIFGFVAFFFVTEWRVEKGDLHMCLTVKDQDVPVTD